MDKLTGWIQKVTSPLAVSAKPNETPPVHRTPLLHASSEAPKSVTSTGTPSVQQRAPHTPKPHHNSAPRPPHAPHQNTRPPHPAHPVHNQASHAHPIGGGTKPMRVIPLGGLNEVGKNCMAVEYGNELILIDVGLQFPEEGMPGIDYVIPDVSYAEQKKQNIRGILITHGHLDHIGALQHIWPKLNFPPIYATRLTKGLIESRLKEFDLLEKGKIYEVNPDKEGIFAVGSFRVEYFRVNHSIPDSCGIYIETPAGNMIHTGDFKFDFTPADGVPCHFAKLVDFQKRGVDAIFADSTNALKKGFCPSEKDILLDIERMVRETKGRLIVATFSSSIGRLKLIVEAAIKNGRKIFVSGRSMANNLEIAHDLGFINLPKSHMRKLGPHINEYPPHEILVLTTGSQGEPLAAMSRIAKDEHPFIKVDFQDTIAFSSSTIPGNERPVYAVIDELHRKGAKVITNIDMSIYTSGHAYQGDLLMMHSLVKPRNIIPIHGEYFMRIGHRKLVMESLGYTEKTAIMIENGDVLEIFNGEVKKTKEKIPVDLVFIEGTGTGGVGSHILKDRNELAQGGVVVVSIDVSARNRTLFRDPRIISRGFLDDKKLHDELVGEAKEAFKRVYDRLQDKVKEVNIREEMEKHFRTVLLKKTDKEPVIMTIVNLV
ncbi:MAG: RNase J family beta-CASP ribonuclease [Candidatus Peregrinibacteria bacterium]